MLTIILIIIFVILLIFFFIMGGNYILRKSIDNILANNKNTKETFDNFDSSVVNPLDECRKMDEVSQNTLNFQTATNIPLSPYYYKDYVGPIYSNDSYINNMDELKGGEYCLRKPKLLYDGIWDSDIEKNKEDGIEYQNWILTNGNLSDDYYCSNKLIQVNKPIPPNFIDPTAVPPIPCDEGKYYDYINDPYQDPTDDGIHCFPQVFNAGMTKEAVELVHVNG